MADRPEPVDVDALRAAIPHSSGFITLSEVKGVYAALDDLEAARRREDDLRRALGPITSLSPAAVAVLRSWAREVLVYPRDESQAAEQDAIRAVLALLAALAPAPPTEPGDGEPWPDIHHRPLDGKECPYTALHVDGRPVWCDKCGWVAPLPATDPEPER